MSSSLVFQVANLWAVTGWLALAAAVILGRQAWISRWMMTIWPLGLAGLYAALILFFFFAAPGGFDSLAHVQLLFTDQWAALAGWVHYLAFDLFIGGWISLQVLQRALPRWLLIGILPLTFLFGPIGLLLFSLARLAFDHRETAA